MMLLTVAELPEFIRTSDKLLTESERMDIVRYLAERPKSGDLMEGTGGVRNFGGDEVDKVKAVAFASSITFTMKQCLCTC